MPLRKECEFEDLQLVWGFNSEEYPTRTLCFWDAKHKSGFDDRGFRCNGGMANFAYYESYEGEYPEWAIIAQQKLKDALVLPDSHNLCWKFSHQGNPGYSECTCHVPKEVPASLLFLERSKIWDGISEFPSVESLGKEKLQELKDEYNSRQ